MARDGVGSSSTCTESSTAPGRSVNTSSTTPRRSRITPGIIIGPMHPLERLLDLVALLLDARKPLTFDDIRRVMPAYQQADAASAKRMFERDKDTLREVGIPVELAATDIWEVEQGYRIPREQYYLPDVAFSPEEVWALFIAAHAPGEEGDAEQAFRKLSTGAES